MALVIVGTEHNIYVLTWCLSWMIFLFYNINGFDFFQIQISDSGLQYFCKVRFSVPLWTVTLMLMKQLTVLCWLFSAPTLTPLPSLVLMLSTSSPLSYSTSWHTCKEEGKEVSMQGMKEHTTFADWIICSRWWNREVER